MIEKVLFNGLILRLLFFCTCRFDCNNAKGWIHLYFCLTLSPLQPVSSNCMGIISAYTCIYASIMYHIFSLHSLTEIRIILCAWYWQHLFGRIFKSYWIGRQDESSSWKPKKIGRLREKFCVAGHFLYFFTLKRDYSLLRRSLSTKRAKKEIRVSQSFYRFLAVYTPQISSAVMINA